jgi:4-amino-4-deoxy-L-arabinose transferase-like glycosyltransferase
MTLLPPQLDRLEITCRRLIDRIAARPRLAAAVLFGLALVCYLPGLLALPPVDRTEVVYAQSSRDMLARGDRVDATFQGERYAFRPIGIYWLQMAAGAVLGKDAQSAVATYRLPSLLGGILAVLAVWGLLRPLIGNRGGLIAAALFAVTPIVALQAELAIPEGPLLLAIVVAQLTLLRLYCAADPRRQTLGLALSFWAAQGFGMLINALAVPILSLATLIALYVFDRDLAWLKRLRPLLGVPLMLVIAAPWLLIRAHLDGGVPFGGLTWHELIRALGGAQDMKWKAAPLTFTLAFVLGFMPGALLLVPALRGLWENRAHALQRFLFCWIVGYWLYLELIASKPGLYTVQAMFPAAAAAAALALEKDGGLALPDYMLRLPAWLVALGMGGVFAGVLYVAGPPVNPIVVAGAILVVALFTLAAQAARRRLAAAWLVTSVAGFALFLAFTFGVVLPHIERGWPAARIAAAIAPLQRCVVGPAGVVGLREPSTVFTLGPDAEANPETLAGWMATGQEGIAVVEDRWHADVMRALQERGGTLPQRAGCIEAFNVMRGCPLEFSIYVTGAPKLDPGCKVPPAFACRRSLSPAPAGTAASRCR